MNSTEVGNFLGKIQQRNAQNHEKELERKTNLIVNYLPSSMSQDEMRDFFSSVGPVESCRLMKDKLDGHSLGYGFVNYTRPEDAESAINRLNGLRLQNKTIKVSYSRPSSEIIKGFNLYISGLPNGISECEFVDLFSKYGKIMTHRLLPAKVNDKGVGFVRYVAEKDAVKAIQELNGSIPPGMSGPIFVKFANSPNRTTQNPNPLPLPALARVFPAPHIPAGKTILPITKGLQRFSPIGDATPLIPQPKIFTGGPACSIFVFNLGPDPEESSLWKLFGPFGAVHSVKVVKEKGFGFVNMMDPEEAAVAIQSLNGFKLNDHVLQVSFKSNKKKF